MTVLVRKVVIGEIVLVEPSEPECWIEHNFDGASALFFAHDCGTQPLSNPFRSEGILRSDKYGRLDATYPEWTIVSENPLTVSPSIQCMVKDCDTHGFFREGKWVPA